MKDFALEKKRMVERLRKCEGGVRKIESILETQMPELHEKIDRVVRDLEEERLNVVLFGSFSDGKSTIISALLGRTDIRISPEPTTDEIKTYPSKDFFVVDTPGLFSEKLEHDEITEKYISEADVVIFTTEAVNPLKESQREVIRWILKDLNKRDQTIIVINKMDETDIDIQDREDFKRMCEIKRKVVIETLNRMLEENREDYNIVCLSADPWGMGIDHWLNNREEYETLSNVKALESLIMDIIKDRKHKLMTGKVNSVLTDISIRQKEEIAEFLKVLEREMKTIEIAKEELRQQVDDVNSELRKAVTRIKERILSYRKSLIGKVSACEDFRCLISVLEEEVGKEGTVFKHRVEIILREELEPVAEYLRDTVKTLEKIEASFENINAMSKDLIKAGTTVLRHIGMVLRITPASEIRDVIIALRDFFKLPIKFKSWQAMKFAKVTKALGPVIELITFGVDIIMRYIFNKKKEEVKENLEDAFKELLSFNEEEVKKELLPAITRVEDSLRELEVSLEELKRKREDIQKVLILLEECRG